MFDHEAIEAIYRRSSISTSLIFTLSHSSVFAQLPIHSLLCSHSKILKNEVTRTAVRTLLSSNLSCSSLEIRAVNADKFSLGCKGEQSHRAFVKNHLDAEA